MAIGNGYAFLAGASNLQAAINSTVAGILVVVVVAVWRWVYNVTKRLDVLEQFTKTAGERLSKLEANSDDANEFLSDIRDELRWQRQALQNPANPPPPPQHRPRRQRPQ